MEKTRIRYSKEFKHNAVFEVLKGKKPLDVLLNSGFDISEVIKKDKKYASKLIYKWKKELLKNKANILSANILDKSKIENELSNLTDYNETDPIKDYIKCKMLTGKSDFRKLNVKIKQIINTKY